VDLPPKFFGFVVPVVAGGFAVKCSGSLGDSEREPSRGRLRTIGHVVEPEVETATTSDLAALAQLMIELHEYAADGVPGRLRIPDTYDLSRIGEHFRQLIQRDDATILVVRVSGTPIGYAEAFVEEQPEPDHAVVPRNRVHLQSLIVNRASRGLGYGRALLRAVENWARDRGADEVELDHWVFQGDPGDFYEEAGYRTIRMTRVVHLDNPGG
jgi:diamine N-acetyltransferase